MTWGVHKQVEHSLSLFVEFSFLGQVMPDIVGDSPRMLQWHQHLSVSKGDNIGITGRFCEQWHVSTLYLSFLSLDYGIKVFSHLLMLKPRSFISRQDTIITVIPRSRCLYDMNGTNLVQGVIW